MKDEFEYYFTTYNVWSTDPQKLGPGPIIFKVKKHFHASITDDSEGPYNSIYELTKNSKGYLSLKSENPKRAGKISNEKWVIKIKNSGYVNDITDPSNFAKMIEHAVMGEIKKNKVAGFHFYKKETVEIIEVLDVKSNGVFKAKIKVFNPKNKRWVLKESSTFFPKKWSFSRLLEECQYAYSNPQKKLLKGKKNTFRSYTKSGIEVVIVIINQKVKTIYPTID